MALQDELKDIVDEEIQKIPPVEFPETMDVNILNQPEVQKVEITNPDVQDLSGLEKVLNKILEKKNTPLADMKRMEELLVSILNKENPVIDNSVLLEGIIKAINGNKPLPVDFSGLSQEMRELVGEVKKVKSSPIVTPNAYRGGAIGPSKINLQNTFGRTVDMAVAVKDDATLSTINPEATLIAGKNKDKAQYIKSIKGSLEIVDTHGRDIQEQILV
ncbi:MAG: hypothetical protein IH823_04200, partial [Candidatus Dadabacteria bacterium]|nr:hypothetical protein [Candidatus Dadabacteria bacterium]